MISCSTCKFYVPFDDEYEGGQCRALPPSICYEAAKRIGGGETFDPFKGFWPTVTPDLGCGYHKEKDIEDMHVMQDVEPGLRQEA